MILKDLPLGSLVKDPNSTYNGQTIVWKVVGQNLTDYPADSTTLMSSKILSIKTFDAKEPSNTDNNRKTSGNNRWLNSNLRQWLNADKNAPWYSAKHSFDAPPNSGTNGNNYDNENGFLTTIGTDFKAAILSTQLKTLIPNPDGGGVENVTDKMFLFSMTEMGLAGTTGKEGTIIPYLNSSTNRVLKPTQEAVTASKYTVSGLNANSNYFYWLRSAFPDFSHINYRIATNGAFTQSIADNDTIGVAPATNLDANTGIAYQDSDGVYVLRFNAVGPVDLSGIQFKLTDVVSRKDITTGNKFSSTVQLDWNLETSEVLFEIELRKDGTVIPYNRKDPLTEVGSYTAIITATDKAISSNKRTSSVFSFAIIPPRKTLVDLVMNDSLTGQRIVNGSEFISKVQPTWDPIQDATISVTYSFNSTYKGSLRSGNTYTDIGMYEATWLITDNNYPDNQRSGIISFEVKKAKVQFPIDLNLRDVVTAKPIAKDSQFELEVTPTWDEDSLIQYNVTMLFNNTLIPFTKEQKLTNIGKYTIKFHLVDKNYTSNTYDVSIPFEIINKTTDLDMFELEFLDINMPAFPNTVISEGKIFMDDEVKPYWSPIPDDCTVSSYSIKRDGNSLPYTPNTDTYVDHGQYKLVIRITNGSGQYRDYTRNFSIVANDIDLTIEVKNDLDKTVIDDGRVFEDTQVLPTWINPQDTDIFYTMKYENKDISFTKGVTILSMKGKYLLELVLVNVNNPTNTETVEINFEIIDKKSNMNEINLTIVNDVTGLTINNNDIYKATEVKPYWYTSQLPDGLVFESWITENGTRRVYDKEDETDILKKVGDYVIEVKVTDPNFPENFKMSIRNFKIIAGSEDLSDKEIIIKNKLTNSEITEGQIFRGQNATVQPTWSEYPSLNYTYKLYFNGSVVTSYTKNNILKEKGLYKINVVATDPNYPSNKIEITTSFSIEDELDNSHDNGDGIEDAYLNGLPYKMGTPITKSGDYNLLVVRKKKTNFKVSMSEVNFMVMNPEEDQKPLIMIKPEFIPSVEDEITIRYPSYGTEYEYKIDNGEWKAYTAPFKVTNNCTIHARFRDPLKYYVETSKDVTNIDKTPPAPPVVLGVKNGDVKLTVTPMVEYVQGVDMTATLDGKPFELGTPIYNEVAEIRDYTLVVTAKKRLNGMSASTIVKFTLDSVPPNPPKIVGVLPDVVQESARPDVNGFLTFFSYETENDFVAKLNGRPFTLKTLVDDPGSYQISVTAIKKTNGLRATSVMAFTIIHKIPPAIGPLRISLEPLTEANKEKAIDGELVVDLDSGHISIYDDGYLISKTRELEELLDLLDKRIVKVDISLQNNETRINSLFNMKSIIDSQITKMKSTNFNIDNDIYKMQSIIKYLNFTDLGFLADFEKELKEIDIDTSDIKKRVTDLNAKIGSKVDLALEIMNGLQTNSSAIGEVIWLKNTQGLRNNKQS